MALAVKSISTSLITDDYWRKVFKKIVVAVYEAPQKIIAKLLSLCLSFFGFLLDKVVWIIHAIIILYAFKHLHFLDDPEVFDAIGADEKTKQLKAVTLLFGLLLYWVWKGLKSLFGKNKKSEELPAQTKE